MKHSKRFKAVVGGLVLGLILCVVTPLNTMITQKSTAKKIRVPEPVQTERYKNSVVWVKSSDGVIMDLPQWQIDQMKVLQVLFVHQKGSNSQDNPVAAVMVTSDQLNVVRQALEAAGDAKKFEFFCKNITQNQSAVLINSANILEAQGLVSLLISVIFPIEVQSQMGASAIQPTGVIAPVVEYLQKMEVILLDHKGSVVSIALSPDGNRIVSGAAGVDNNLILYDLKAGKEIKKLELETFPVPCVAFSPDGKYIATGSSREFDSLIVWDGVTGEKIKVLGTKPVNCVAFSPDSNYILAGTEFRGYGYKPILYDVKTGKILATYVDNSAFFPRVKNSFEDFNDSMSCVAFRPGSNEMVLGSGVAPSSWYNVVLYDSKTYKQVRPFVGLSQGSPYIAFSADGKYLIGGTLDLILWDAETGKEITVFKSLWGRVTCVAFHPSGQYIIAGYKSSQNNLLLLNSKTGLPVTSFKNANCAAFSPDGNYLFCGSDQALVVYKILNKKTLDYIATRLNLAQARLLYRLYLAKNNHVPVIMDSRDLDYHLFNTLPDDVRKAVKGFLSFELVSDIAEKVVEEKMNEYRMLLFYHTSRIWGRYEKKHDEKIKALEKVMQGLDKNSVDYKACEKLLMELEQEAAFDV